MEERGPEGSGAAAGSILATARGVLAPSEENRRWAERNARWLSPVIRLILRPWLQLTVEGAPPQGPALILCNHVHFLDPILLILGANRAIHFLAAESLWQRAWTTFFCWIGGAVPRKKFVHDHPSIRQLQAWQRAGGAVGLFPEGERSWDGRGLPLVPGIERLIRMMGVPVVCCRIYNGHRHGPRWGKMRRGRMHLVFDPPKTFARNTPIEEITAYLEDRLRVDPEVGADWPIHGRDLALGITNLLFLCPACGAQDRLAEAGDEIRCGGCGQGWRVDAANRLHPLGGSREAGGAMTLIEAVDRQRARLEARWAEEAAGSATAKLLESEPMELRESAGTEQRTVGRGRLCLSRERLWVEEGQGAGGREVWGLPLAELAAVTVDLTRKLQFRSADRAFEAVLPKESVLKWNWIVRHWKGEIPKAEAG